MAYVTVNKNTSTKQWGCAKRGLEESKRAVNQLLSIVRIENDIDPDEKWSIIMSIEKGE